MAFIGNGIVIISWDNNIFKLDLHCKQDVALPSFLFSHIFLVFVYLSLRLFDSFKLSLLSICFGVFVNYIIVMFEVPLFEIRQFGRLKGTLGNANFFGFLVNFNVIFLFILKEETSSELIKKILWLLIVLALIFVFMSGSKTNILIYFVILTAHAFSNLNFRKISSFFKFGFSLIGILVLIYNLFESDMLKFVLTDESEIFQRVEYISNVVKGKEQASKDMIRINMINFGWENWGNAPVFGHGYDAYTTNSPYGTYSHNNFIELIYNSGLFGVCLFYSLYLFFL